MTELRKKLVTLPQNVLKTNAETMKRLWMIAVASLLTVGVAQSVAQPKWPEVKNETKAGSRWWWMGSAVDEENLKWNIEQYAKAGLGTLEISPIYGVQGNGSKNIAFMSPQWLDMQKYAKEQGQRHGIDIDMITGTGWPFGGPMIKSEWSASKLGTQEVKLTGDGEKEQTVTLSGSGTLQRVLAYPQKGNDGTMTDLMPMVDGKKVKWTAPAGDWRVIAVYCQPGAMQVKRPSPGFEGMVLDHFDAEAVKGYLEWFDSRYEVQGTSYVWPRSFFNDSYEISAADWTRGMFEEFEKYRGYKLETVMDKLIDKNAQVTADYRQTLSDMLLHNFTEQWTAWAHSHGATTRNQAHGSPGNLIDLYAAADIPEIESFYLSDFGIKGLRSDNGFTMKALSTLPTLKYASSAAHVTGKRLVSSESMTWLTEHFRSSLSQMKPELDQLFVAGVNRVLFHGTTYSPREAAWPGWKFYAAVDMSPTNSIWRDAPEMMKYIERVQSFLQMGEPDNDLLVYAPFVNAMHKTPATRLLQFDINHMDERMKDLAQCVNAILAAGLDCDYTSERLLMQTQLKDGLLVTPGGTSYKALVVPVGTNMPDSVKSHLETLAAEGAKIAYDYTPTTLAGLGIKGEPMRADYGLKLIRRRNATGYHYFVANLSADHVEGYVELAVPAGSVVLFNPLTGDIADAPTDGGRVYISLKSGQSVLLQTYDAATTSGKAIQPVQEMGEITLNGQWRLSFTDDSWPLMTGKQYELERAQTWETLDEQTARLMGTGVYETTFTVSEQQMSEATGGFRLNLGDVRESARVWLNGEYLGCAWSVPYVIDCNNKVRAGENTLKIEVTNLPANRIRQMDIEGTVWRIFEDTNINSISNSNDYTKWALMPSGLNSQVRLVPLAANERALTVGLKEMKAADGGFVPLYELSTMNGKAITTVNAIDADGRMFAGVKADVQGDGSAELTVSGVSASLVTIKATDADGSEYLAYVPAKGVYQQPIAIDFTAEQAPQGGWDKLASTSTIKGFEGTGDLGWYRTKKSSKTATLYDGVTFNSTASNYYFYFTGYGMNTSNDFQAEITATPGDIAQLTYKVGTDTKTAKYDDAPVKSQFTTCDEESQQIVLDMPGNKSYYIYRSLNLYRPQAAVGVEPIVNHLPTTTPTVYYNLHGQRVSQPSKGIYIVNGIKRHYSR